MKTEVDTNGDHPYLASSAKLLGRKSDDKKKENALNQKIYFSYENPQFRICLHPEVRWKHHPLFTSDSCHR
jgi:hypothetical protein